jgi:excisionase family DNA binding protein
MQNQPLPMAYGIKESVISTGLSKSTIYRLIEGGKLETVRIGGRHLIKAASLRRLLQADGVA